jgi:hypothetical protein
MAMRMVFEVTDEFHRLVREYAANHGVSLKALVTAALTAQTGLALDAQSNVKPAAAVSHNEMGTAGNTCILTGKCEVGDAACCGTAAYRLLHP